MKAYVDGIVDEYQAGKARAKQARERQHERKVKETIEAAFQFMQNELGDDNWAGLDLERRLLSERTQYDQGDVEFFFTKSDELQLCRFKIKVGNAGREGYDQWIYLSPKNIRNYYMRDFTEFLDASRREWLLDEEHRLKDEQDAIAHREKLAQYEALQKDLSTAYLVTLSEWVAKCELIKIRNRTRVKKVQSALSLHIAYRRFTYALVADDERGRFVETREANVLDDGELFDFYEYMDVLSHDGVSRRKFANPVDVSEVLIARVGEDPDKVFSKHYAGDFIINYCVSEQVKLRRLLNDDPLEDYPEMPDAPEDLNSNDCWELVREAEQQIEEA